jgi:hypothetical protein
MIINIYIMRRILAISSIGNQPHNLHGKYVPGSGVGASSVSARRLKQHRAAQCYPPSQIQYLRVSDIATYSLTDWILNENTVITAYQYLIIYSTEALRIPYNMTFTNNGQVDNYGYFYTDSDTTQGATIYNTGKFNNYGSIEVELFCEFYTYGGGSVYNSTSVSPDPIANIVVVAPPSGNPEYEGLFAMAPTSGSTCGSGTFTGKTTLSVGSVTYTCP